MPRYISKNGYCLKKIDILNIRCFILYKKVDIQKSIYIEDYEAFSKYGKNVLKYLFDKNKAKEVYFFYMNTSKFLKDMKSRVNVFEIANMTINSKIYIYCFITKSKKRVLNSSYLKLLKSYLVSSIFKKILYIETGVTLKNFKILDIYLDSSKEIYAIPGSILSIKSGIANYIIKNGGNTVTTIKDFI